MDMTRSLNDGVTAERRKALEALVTFARASVGHPSPTPELFDAIHRALSRGSGPDRIKTDDTLLRKLDREIVESLRAGEVDLKHFLRAHLSGEALDVALELHSGFDSTHSASAVFSACVQSKRDSEARSRCASRLRFALIGGHGIERTPLHRTQLLLDFEFPYKRSLFNETLALLPEIRTEHPHVYQMLEQRSSPMHRVEPANLRLPPPSLQWEGLPNMSLSTRSRLYELGLQPQTQHMRRACERLLASETFRSIDCSAQEITFEVFFSVLPIGREHLVQLLEGPRAHTLFTTQPMNDLAPHPVTGNTPMDLLHEMCVGPLDKRLMERRNQVVSLALLALSCERMPGRSDMPVPVQNAPMELALRRGDIHEYLRMFRDLVGPYADTWIRHPRASVVHWWGRENEIITARTGAQVASLGTPKTRKAG